MTGLLDMAFFYFLVHFSSALVPSTIFGLVQLAPRIFPGDGQPVRQFIARPRSACFIFRPLSLSPPLQALPQGQDVEDFHHSLFFAADLPIGVVAPGLCAQLCLPQIR